MATILRWVLPLAVLAGCTPETGKPPRGVDLDVVNVLRVVLEHMNAEGDSVRLLQGVFCSTEKECWDLASSAPEASPELESLGASSATTLVLAKSGAEFPPFSWSDEAGEVGGFIVWFEEPEIAGDSAVVSAERFCVGYGKADSHGLVREGPGWRVIAVTRIWET